MSVGFAALSEALPINSVSSVCIEDTGILSILFQEIVCLQMTDMAAEHSHSSFNKSPLNRTAIAVIIFINKALLVTMTMIP
jgi:hypothetical protein